MIEILVTIYVVVSIAFILLIVNKAGDIYHELLFARNYAREAAETIESQQQEIKRLRNVIIEESSKYPPV